MFAYHVSGRGNRDNPLYLFKRKRFHNPIDVCVVGHGLSHELCYSTSFFIYKLQEEKKKIKLAQRAFYELRFYSFGHNFSLFLFSF